jgi:hypothetical protein
MLQYSELDSLAQPSLKKRPTILSKTAEMVLRNSKTRRPSNFDVKNIRD